MDEDSLLKRVTAQADGCQLRDSIRHERCGDEFRDGRVGGVVQGDEGAAPLRGNSSRYEHPSTSNL
jgi:hypothetical protein